MRIVILYRMISGSRVYNHCLFWSIIHYCTDDETFVRNLFYLLHFPAQIMHETFVNMVLTEEDEMVVPLCLIVIALALQHLDGL